MFKYSNFVSIIFIEIILIQICNLNEYINLNLNKDIKSIHIRLSDYKKFTDRIKDKILEYELELEENEKFLLVSDDIDNAILFFDEKIRKNIIYRKNLINPELKNDVIYRSKESIIDGIVDFLLLLNTKFIFKYSYSTFAVLAHLLGDANYDNIQDFLLLKNLHIFSSKN